MASKRRALIYTLPIVVGVGFLTVAGLAAWRRADLIATLSDQIARGQKSEAAVAVLQLAAISNPPLAILVEAAACDAAATVEAAQVAINKLLDDWQREVDNGQRLGRIADEVSTLAAALAEQRRTFPTSSYPWLASVTHKMIRVADKCPSKDTPLFALHCDEVITIVGNVSYAFTTSAAPPSATAMPKQVDVGAANAGNNPTNDRAQLEQTFSSFSSSPIATDSTERRSKSDNPKIPDVDTRERTDGNMLRHQSVQPGPNGSDQAPNEFSETIPDTNESADDPGRAPPESRVPPNSHDARRFSTTASDSRESSGPLGTYSTRELLERWRTASGDEHRGIEFQLASRGFKHLSPALVQLYLSTDDDRSRIVDAILKLPGPEVRPWLFLLADDEDADVRLLAVTVMATSDDKALIEKAWQISIRDQDPRIADLSAHLRERRAGTQLR